MEYVRSRQAANMSLPLASGSLQQLNTFNFKVMSVTTDALHLVVGDQSGSLISVDLDDYFNSCPSRIEASPLPYDLKNFAGEALVADSKLPAAAAPAGSDHEQWRNDFFLAGKTEQADSSLLHWYERTGQVRATFGISWDSESLVKQNKPRIDYSMNGFTSKSNSNTMVHSVLSNSSYESESETKSSGSPGESTLASPAETPRKILERAVPFKEESSINGRILFPSEKVANAELSVVALAPLSILAQYSQAQSVIIFNRETGIPVRFEFPRPSVLLFNEDNSWYYMDKEGLHVLLMGKNLTQQKILNNLIMLESSTLADNLCELNGWDRRSLRFHALELGLRYRQLDVIEPALQNLDPDQQYTGAELLLEYVTSNELSVQEEEFMDQLIQIGMNFLSGIVQVKVSEVLKEQPNAVIPTLNERIAGSANFSGVPALDQLYDFATILDSLRACQLATHALEKRPNQQEGVKQKGNFGVQDKLKRSASKPMVALKPRVLFSKGKEQDIDEKLSESSKSLKKSSETAEGEDFNKNGVDLSSIPLSFGIHHEHWERMNENEVMKDALVKGNLSLVISFLQWRREKSTISSGMSDLLGSANVTLHDVKKVGHQLVYQAVCQQQLDVATKMLQNMGENAVSNFKEIAFKTSRREVRAVLLGHLSKHIKFTDEELALIDYCHLLEHLYPNPSYSHMHSNVSARQTKTVAPQYSSIEGSIEQSALYYTKHSHEDTPHDTQYIGKDIDDLTPAVEKQFGFEIGSRENGNVYMGNTSNIRNKILIPPPAKGSKLINGYSHFAIDWISQWDKETKDRVVLDKKTPESSGSLYQLKYYIAHNQWKSAVDWVKKYNLNGHVDENGRFCSTSHSNDADELIAALPEIIKCCTVFLRELLLNELARKGIFLETPEEPFFQAVLRRLCKIGLLFYDGANGPLLEELLPKSKLSSFHQYFVHYCIEKSLPSLLQVYLEFYELDSSLDLIMKQFSPKLEEKLWAKLLLQLRTRNDLFEASLCNAQIVLKQYTRATVNSMMKSGHYYMALATISASSYSFDDAMGVSPNHPAFVERSLLQKFVKSFPTLEAALFANDVSPSPNSAKRLSKKRLRSRDIATHQGDVTLMELLQLTSPFKLDKVFGSLDPPPRTHESFAEPFYYLEHGDQYLDAIDVYYLLSTGRPFEAYELTARDPHAALKGSGKVIANGFVVDIAAMSPYGPNGRLKSQSNENKSATLALSESETEYLKYYVRIAGLLNLTNAIITTSCVCYLELCGISTQEIRIDIEAAQRMLSYRTKVDNNKANRSPAVHRDPKHANNEDQLKGIVNMFISFSSPDQLYSALLLLEESTKNFVSPNPEVSKWLLVTQFCSVHSLPLSSGHLCELAEKNEWVTFLYEAETQKFPPEQVQHIIENHFSDPALRDQLSVFIQTFTKKSRSQVDINILNLLRPEDIDDPSTLHEIMLWARSQYDTRSSLLKCSLESNRPFLAVLASCFASEEASLLDCLVVFILSTHPDILKPVRESLGLVELDFESSKWQSTSQAALSECITSLSEQRVLLYLQRAFILFDPNGAFVEYLHFHHEFIESNWEMADKYLQNFIKRLKDPAFESRTHGIADAAWTEELSMSLIQLLFTQCPSAYEISHLLQFVTTANFGVERYSHLLSSFNVVKSVGLDVGILTPPTEIIIKLVEERHFSAARNYAKENGLPFDEITLEETKNLVETAKEEGRFEVDQERIALWNKINELFLDFNCSYDIAGPFFHEQYRQLTGENSKEQIPPNEKLLLLSISYTFLTEKAPVDQSPRRGLIEEIENEMLYLNTELALNCHSSMEADIRHQKVMESILRKMFADGNFERAESLCNQFRFQCEDLAILKVILGICNRSIKMNEISPEIIALYNSKRPGEELVNANKMDVAEVLASFCTIGKPSADRIATNFKVAQTLNLPYVTITTKDAYDVFHFLLMYGKDMYPLCKLFIDHNNLDLTKVAVLLADFYFKTLLESANTKSRADIMNNADFTQYVSLSKRPREIGTRLLNLITKHEHIGLSASGTPPSGTNLSIPKEKPEVELSLTYEVELLIRAHFCFVLACNMAGVDLVLKFVNSRVQDYVNAGEYNLLVRLLKGIRSYNELQYIFGILIKHDRFELLLQKNQDDELGLRVALHTYLQMFYPEDKEKMEMLYLRFNMFREIAELTEMQAWKKVKALRNHKPGYDLNPRLLAVMQHFLDAADNYYKEKCYNLSNKCLNMASLIGLQAQVPDTRMINLTDAELNQLLNFRGNFEDALIIARAYGRTAITDWAGPIFQQVLVNNNFGYWKNFLTTFPPSAELFSDLHKRYKSEGKVSANVTATFKQLLNFMDDQFLKYEICKDLGFAEMESELLSELQYFRDLTSASNT
eukprot:TRINITY_DN4541_c0_g1_i2.p1 TRINITY_DN4541_c0_g1~~TRINITY_DN4541_c0_g1_i2.p1  ORF type:complete len:2374 (-),score=676.40 TRINITY_DN4541_c0_g1_i2:45-7166(-)